MKASSRGGAGKPRGNKSVYDDDEEGSKKPLTSAARISNLLARNELLVETLAKLKQENNALRQQVRVYKRRSVILREQNALLLAGAVVALSEVNTGPLRYCFIYSYDLHAVGQGCVQ